MSKEHNLMQILYANHCSSSVPAAPHRSSEWLRAGCRAAAGRGGTHGPERFRWMAASSCCSLLGSGKVNNLTGSRKLIMAHGPKVSDAVFIIGCCCRRLLFLFQMHVAELLVSHGASLNAKTFLEETPIGRFIPQHSRINTPGGGLSKQMSYLSWVSFSACSVNTSFPSWVCSA